MVCVLQDQETSLPLSLMTWPSSDFPFLWLRPCCVHVLQELEPLGRWCAGVKRDAEIWVRVDVA